MKKGLKVLGVVSLLVVVLAVIVSLIPGGDSELEKVNQSLESTSQELQQEVEERVDEDANETASAEWVEVKEFSGTGDVDKSTENIAIFGKEWRVLYSFSKDIDTSTVIFGGNIYSADGSRVGSWTATEEGDGNTFVKQGNGEYYLKIVGGNIASWKVQVEELSN